VTPLGRITGEVLAVEGGEVKRGPARNGGIELGSATTNDLQRRLPFLAAIVTGQIEVLPVADGFGPELGAIPKALAVEEFIFDEPMHGLDIALPGVGAGRDVAMVAAQGPHGGGQATLLLVLLELGAVVGLPDHARQIDAMPREVGTDVFGQYGGVALGQFVGIADEGQATDDLAHGVLEAG
jgi:hypothetical protein